MQTDATLLDVTCCVRLHTLLYVVAQSLKPVKLFSQQLPTFLLFCDRRSVAQQCWIRLHGSSDIVGATHAHSAWITKTYGLYSSHGALQVPNLLHPFAHHCQHVQNNSQHCWRKNVGSCCARLHPALASNTDEDSFITRSRATNVCEAGGRDEALRTSALKTKLSLKSNS